MSFRTILSHVVFGLPIGFLKDFTICFAALHRLTFLMMMLANLVVKFSKTDKQ